MKRILFFLIAASLPFAFKKNFKLPPILPNLPPYQAHWETPLPKKEILSILEGPFVYLSKGNQSTVFESADGQYVLKLFRYSRPRFLLLQKIKNSLKKTPKMDLSTKIHKTLQGAYLAHEKASDFTQVIFTHLNLTKNLLPKTTFIKGRTFVLPLDCYRFVLQRKITPLKKALLLARGNPEKMHRMLDSFADLMLKRTALNIQNTDPNLTPNFGFLNEKAVEIDFGNYRLIDADPQIRKQEIANFFDRFQTLLNTLAPEFVPYLQTIQSELMIKIDEEIQVS